MRTPQENGKKRLYEVHYKNSFVQHHLWGEKIRGIEGLVLPVSMLCHVTHRSQAEQIRTTYTRGQLHFMPNPKPGKSYIEDGRPLGESYCCVLDSTSRLEPDDACYKPITDRETVFPGFYSWWGLALDSTTSQSLRRDKLPASLPGYLQDPPDSCYGSIAFVSDFQSLLTSYANSRGCKPDEIYLRIGGTLRYKKEICYVVIICTNNDLEVLQEYDPITSSEIFDTADLVDRNGKVVNIASTPIFTTRHVDTFASYETLNFAFFFEDARTPFVCSVNGQDIAIDHTRCVRKIPLVCWYDPQTQTFTTKWKCPDEITESHRKTDKNVREFAKSCT